MAARPPIVTILGHVDHGKTTLLDYIRKSKITQKEHGGITQRIGAYEVSTGIKGYHTDKITFIDTPGHEAYAKLRARGANVADIALLIIDAKDSIKPQTKESISHIKAADIPFIVVLNKTDLPDANPERVKIDLMKNEVMVEGKGGNTPLVLISAKTGKGVPELLESILLLAAERNLSFESNNPTLAYVIETKKDKRGLVASIVIKDGTLKTGDIIYSDSHKAKVKAMTDDLGRSVSQIVPSAPVELLGFNEMPEVGTLISTELKIAQSKDIASEPRTTDKHSLESLFAAPTDSKTLTAIIKTDAQGSLEAIEHSISKNKDIEVVLAGVGGINKSDVFLAKTTNAIVLGFNVKPDIEVDQLAKQEKVIIKTYNIIYELLEELTEVADLLREKEERTKNLKGEAKVLATFVIENEKVYGIKVTKGKANLGDPVELYRNNGLIGKTKLTSLKMRAKVVPEVKKDQEAGMFFSPELDIRVGDMVKFVL